MADGNPGPQPRFLTLKDVSALLNVGEAQVKVLVRTGQLPAIRLGRKRLWRVDPGRLEEFIATLQERTRASIESGPVDPVPAPRGRRPRKQRVWAVEELPPEEETFTVREARRVLSASSRQIHYLIRTGRLRARKEGQRWLVALADVIARVPPQRPKGSQLGVSIRAGLTDDPTVVRPRPQ